MVLNFITLLLVCQLAGEVISVAFGIPVPGPVIGMALLFAGLVVRGSLADGLKSTAGGLLDHLSLLFVPAGAGVMLHLGRITDEWQPIVVALIGSTIITIAVTALVMRGLQRLTRNGDDG